MSVGHAGGIIGVVIVSSRRVKVFFCLQPSLTLYIQSLQLFCLLSPDNITILKMFINIYLITRDREKSVPFIRRMQKLLYRRWRICVEVVDIAYNIQYLRVNSLVHITFFITSKMSGLEPTK